LARPAASGEFVSLGLELHLVESVSASCGGASGLARLSIVIQKMRQLTMQKIAIRFTSRSAVLSRHARWRKSDRLPWYSPSLGKPWVRFRLLRRRDCGLRVCRCSAGEAISHFARADRRRPKKFRRRLCFFLSRGTLRINSSVRQGITTDSFDSRNREIGLSYDAAQMCVIESLSGWVRGALCRHCRNQSPVRGECVAFSANISLDLLDEDTVLRMARHL
jgi:hypothetical protein